MATEIIPPHDNPQGKDENLAFLEELLKNPLQFSLEKVLHAGSDAPPSLENEAAATESTFSEVQDDDKHVFCKPMMPMMMNGHQMAHHGVASMPLGGDMSNGMIMYMDGFRFAMAGNQPCLNLYFPSWTLDTPFKFLLSLLFVFLLSFGTEGVSKFRHVLSQRPFGREFQSRRTKQMVISGLHGVQALLGYVVMLATMTFSLEILFSVVLGLSTGYYYFFAGEVGLEGHVTTNPCCSYMQDETNEHQQAQQQQQQQQQQNQQQQQSTDEMTMGLLSTPRGSQEEYDSPTV